MVFAGTPVAPGQATAAVTSTGTATQIGRISGMLNRAEGLTTPLLRQINSFARWFTLFIFLRAALLFAFAVTVRGCDWTDTLVAVVALPVGAMPEGAQAGHPTPLPIRLQRSAPRNVFNPKLTADGRPGAVPVC